MRYRLIPAIYWTIVLLVTALVAAGLAHACPPSGCVNVQVIQEGDALEYVIAVQYAAVTNDPVAQTDHWGIDHLELASDWGAHERIEIHVTYEGYARTCTTNHRGQTTCVDTLEATLFDGQIGYAEASVEICTTNPFAECTIETEPPYQGQCYTYMPYCEQCKTCYLAGGSSHKLYTFGVCDDDCECVDGPGGGIGCCESPGGCQGPFEGPGADFNECVSDVCVFHVAYRGAS